MPKREYPTLITWTEPDGKTHIPPDPPLVEGCPPWYPRVLEYRRDTPLKKCPSSICRRTHNCAALLYGKYCQKTHMEQDAFRWKLVRKLEVVMRQLNIPQSTDITDPSPTPPPEMKRALQAREEECERESLLKFQTEWIERQKRSWQQKHKPVVNPAVSRRTLTTR